jgi:hypothetical protein
MTSDRLSRTSSAAALAAVVGAAAASGYLLVWERLKGDGCGPLHTPATAMAYAVFKWAPWVLLAIGAAAVLATGAALKWRPRTILMAVLITLVVAALGGVLVFVFEFGAGHCGE